VIDYRNNASQKERAEVLRNDARANTFAGRASAEADEIRGRFAQEHKATVIGSDGAPNYPRLPETNWVNDPVPPEEPLGFSVEAHEPVGEVGEIAKSLDGTADATNVADVASPCGEVVVSSSTLGDVTEAVAQSAPLAAVAAPLEVHASPADVEHTAAIPNPKRRSLR
jgi:hypothetical protein